MDRCRCPRTCWPRLGWTRASELFPLRWLIPCSACWPLIMLRLRIHRHPDPHPRTERSRAEHRCVLLMIASELVHGVLPGTVLAHAEDDKLHTCPEVAERTTGSRAARGAGGGRWGALERDHRLAPPQARPGQGCCGAPRAAPGHWQGARGAVVGPSSGGRARRARFHAARRRSHLLHGPPPALPQRADLLLDSGEAPAPSRLPPRKLAHRWAVAGPRASTPEREASELKYNWLRPR